MKIMLLKDKYAAITVAQALLIDRIQGLQDGADKDQLQYLTDVLGEMQAEIGSQINLIKSEVSGET